MTTPEQIAVMVIKVGMTQQPESYTSVRRDIELPVFIRPEDDSIGIARIKMAEAVKIVENSIDDDFERGHGARAKYSDEPRYDYIYDTKKDLAVIIPENSEPPRGWDKLPMMNKGHRLAHLKKSLSHYKTVIDCSQDFTALEAYPEIHRGIFIYGTEGPKIAILTSDENEPPNELLKQYIKYWGRDYGIDFEENLIKWAQEKATKRSCELYICWDGDLSQIPPPKATEPEPDNEDDNIDEEDEEDEDF